MEKDELKRKDTVINLLLETLIKYKDNHDNEQRNILSNHDEENTQSEKILKQRN